MFSSEHGDRVESLVQETPGVHRYRLDFDEELLHVVGQFDELLLKNSLERAGFIVYLESNEGNILYLDEI